MWLRNAEDRGHPGLIFLKYISDSFEAHHGKLLAGEGDYAGADPEDPDEYKAENIFWGPQEARWSHLQGRAKLPSIGKDVDDAMDAIERDNPRLKGALNKNYGRADLDKHRLGDGKQRWVQVVTELSRAFALCAASDEAVAIRDDVSFFQAIQAALNKQNRPNQKSPEQIDAAIRQLVSKAITTEGEVIDVFTAAGLQKPDISILSDGFLAAVRGLKHKNVAAELLEKLLKDELKVRSKKNLVQSQLFSDKLKKTLNAYHNRAISTLEVIEELIKLAKEMDSATKRGVNLGLTDDEVAFYDALAVNESAVKAMGDEKLKVIASELIAMVRKSVTIDWTLRESARAKIRVIVKRILNKYGYPPDLQAEAVKTVLEQAKLLADGWALE